MSMANRLLREFYGLESPNKEQEVRDIDSPHFDAKSFFEHCVQTDSLPQLFARENSLVSDIRAFDSDLQALVYDNYSKFLGASETVRSLSTKITTLSEEMGQLKSNLTGVAQHSDEIGSALEPNRQRIQRLVGISRLLERVQFISKLPVQLRACLKTGKCASAVNVWTKVEGILVSQKHFPSFQKIHKECALIMEDINARIRSQMLNTDASVEDSIENAVLLVKLKVPLGLVCSQIVHHRFLLIDNTLESDHLGDPIPEEPFAALSTLKEIVINDTALFIRLFREKLLGLDPDRDVQAKVNPVLQDFMGNTFDRISQFLPSKVLFELDCNKMGSYLSLFADLMSKIATEQQIAKHLHRVLQQYTEAKTMRVFDDFVATIGDKSGRELFDQATAQFTSSCGRLIGEFHVLAMLNHPECCHFLIQQMSLMFGRVFEFFTTTNPENALVYSVIASAFSEKDIPEIFEQLSRLDQDSPLQSLQEKTSRDCKAVVHTCLARFVSYRRQIGDRFIEEVITQTQWVAISNPPSRVSPAISRFCADLQALSAEILGLIPLTRQPEPVAADMAALRGRLRSGSYTANSFAPTFSGARDDGIPHIDRLFMSVNRLHLSRELRFEARSIIGAIVMYSLKTFLEFIRLSCFSSHGFNQIQVDVYSLYSVFSEKVGDQDQELFAGLIEEIISSAADRTAEPRSLDREHLAAIAASSGLR
jgi:hypothetical protein